MPDLQERYLTAAQLKKERGWTDSMIRDLLGEPDKTMPNPYYRTAAGVRYWLRDRVEAAESGGDFAARKIRGAARSGASAAAAERRRRALLATVDAVTVTVPVVPDEVLARRAVEHRNMVRAYHFSGDPRDDFEYATVQDTDPAALARWKVNYLRHVLTGYEDELAAVAGKVGVRDAGDIIRAKVYDAIAAAYPDLARECGRQLSERRR